MATLEVRIKYETNLTRACYWAVTLASPAWGLLPIAICFFNLFASTRFFPDGIPIYRILNCSDQAIPLFIVGIYLWFFFRDNNLVISQQGICFPPTMLALMFRRNCPWYKLESISLDRDETADDYRLIKLALHYSGGCNVNLNLRYLSPTDVEQLLLGLETFGAAAKGLENVSELKRLVKTELKIEGIKSFTNLWDDELRYRYASTTFIPLNPGSTLQDGQIKVLRQLGFGGLSAIYLVQRNNKELAILKESVLPADVDEELRKKAEEQFEREAKILATLSHPQIARVLDHFVERGHYLLLEYIHGQDLRQYVTEKGPLPEQDVLSFGVQIADILNYLHSREPSIIHRDLTPENLIVNNQGLINLIDFGAANQFLHTATGTLVGKHAYMAPEQLKGKANASSDLYSLGCTIHFLLTGIDPIPLSASHPSALNASVSAEMDALVFSLTQAKTDARIQSAAELKTKIKSMTQQGVK